MSLNNELNTIFASIKPSAALINLLKENKATFLTFGKKNSHILRKKLMDLFSESNLSKEAQFMVYFFCAMIKRKDRIMDGLEKLPDTLKEESWFDEVHDFFEEKCVTFPDDETSENFATIHLPSTNPPLSIACRVMMVSKKDRTLDMLLDMQEFGQIHINTELQMMHKEKMKKFWTETVTKTTHKTNQMSFNRIARTEKAFQEDIYQNQANDKYPLMNMHWKTVMPTNEETGYTKEEIVGWLESF